jgi:hypothetical protein
MKKILLAMLLLGSMEFSHANGNVYKKLPGPHKELLRDGAQTSHFFSNDPCLDQALFAMNNAFSLTNVMIDWCWSVNTTPQGYNDCSQYWIDWRRNIVADIYANMTSCPESELGGAQTRQKDH